MIGDHPSVGGPPDETEHCHDDECWVEADGECDCDCVGCVLARKVERRADYEDGRADYERDRMQAEDYDR